MILSGRFFKTHCIQCHGPDKSKGELTLHTLDGDLAAGADLDRWEQVLEALESGVMPPEDADQPDASERQPVIDWIDNGLRAYVEKASRETPANTARRLTNFEYENTMRDLLGVDLDLIGDLPQDPVKPYHFNNTAEFMLLGPEQIEPLSRSCPPRHGQRHRRSGKTKNSQVPTGMGFGGIQPKVLPRVSCATRSPSITRAVARRDKAWASKIFPAQVSSASGFKPPPFFPMEPANSHSVP